MGLVPLGAVVVVAVSAGVDAPPTGAVAVRRPEVAQSADWGQSHSADRKWSQSADQK